MSTAKEPARPRVKPIYGVFYLAGRVRLGTGLGYAAEVADPDGRYASLIRLLDGERLMASIVEELAASMTESEVREAITALVDAGYVEDAAVPVPDELSDRECERYRANLNFFSTLPNSESRYAHQAKLKQLRVALIGLGGIGSNVAMALAELGVAAITAIDFDRVELSNLNRQVLYSTPEVGHLKSEVAGRRIAAFNPEVEFTAVAERIASVADVERFLDLARADVVFCLADKPNGFIDHWVNEVCVRRELPMFAGGIFAAIGNAYCVLPGGVCYACRVGAELQTTPALVEELDYVRATEFNVSNGAMGPTCMFHAYFLTYEMVRHVLELGPPLTADSLFEIDFVTFAQTFTKFDRREDCAICGSAPATREATETARV